ncbi:phage major capsid protein, partial [bacterium]
IDGLGAAVLVDPTAAGTYGGIDQVAFPFWQNQTSDNTAAVGLDPTQIQGLWNTLWASQVRGTDRPDLIVCDNTVWSTYVESLQALQRFTSPEVGNLGFPALKYMDADVCFDGGIGGFCPAGTAFFLNCDYIHYRPHSARNTVPLSPNRRYATNQDAEVQILAWAGNLTTSGRQFQGRYDAVGV